MRACLKRVVLLSLGVVIVSASAAFASSKDPIRLGVYNFPPIAMVDRQSHAEGLLGNLLEELRKVAGETTFRIVHTSPKRRHLDFKNNLFDVIFFENPNWSWNPDQIEVSVPILRDDEVYVALNKENRDQSFFDEISERRIVAIAGYHYGFAGMETDSKELIETFDIELSHSHDRNLDLIQVDRPSVAEVAVVSRSFLKTYFSRFPDQRDRFLVSEKVDQSYELHIIARKNGPVSVDQIESLLQPLIDSGRYRELVQQHGLQLPENMQGSP